MIEPNRKQWWFILLAVVATSPTIILGVLTRTGDLHVSPGLSSLIFGIGILASAFLLSWGAEAAQRDVSSAFALALVAIITVLPEYAVDFTLAWKAADDPTYAHYAVANMTGANRLLIGIGWPLVVILAWSAWRVRRVPIHANHSIEILFLGIATVWALFIVARPYIPLPFNVGSGLYPLDAVVLISLFIVYMWLSARAEVHEPDLIGPAALIGAFPKVGRRLAVAVLFIFPAGIIFLSAEPFAEGLIEGGKTFGIDEFLLIQWVAPLASEAPEMVVACIFALRGAYANALGMLISAKVNQWTLLVGSLPVVYSVSAGSPSALPLDTRQVEEVFLTAAQSGFALILLAPLFLSPRGSAALFVLFIGQLLIPAPTIRLVFAGVYLLAAAGLFLFDGQRRRAVILLPRSAFQKAEMVEEAENDRGLRAEEESPKRSGRRGVS